MRTKEKQSFKIRHIVNSAGMRVNISSRMTDRVWHLLMRWLCIVKEVTKDYHHNPDWHSQISLVKQHLADLHHAYILLEHAEIGSYTAPKMCVRSVATVPGTAWYPGTRYLIDTFDYKLDKDDYTGRVVLDVVPIVRTELVAGNFKRWFVKKFPKLFRPLDDKFNTYVDIVMRFWWDTDNYQDVVYASVKITDNILPSDKEDLNEKSKREARARYFAARRSISGF